MTDRNKIFNRIFLVAAAVWLITMVTVAMGQGVSRGHGTGFGDGRVVEGRYGAPPSEAPAPTFAPPTLTTTPTQPPRWP